MGTAEKVFKVRSQGSGSQQGQIHFFDWGISIDLRPSVRCPRGGGILLDGIASRLTCNF